MPEAIVYIDRSEIRAGMLADLTTAISSIVAFVEEHEPQLISYGFFIDPATSEMSVVAVHPDSASLEFHLGVAGPEFRKVRAFIDLRSIEVFGVPSQTVLDRLNQKAQALGKNPRVIVHHAEAGFSRL